MSYPTATLADMVNAKTLLQCSACGKQVSRWVGRCPGCDEWGTVHAGAPVDIPVPLIGLGAAPEADRRVSTGFDGIDRVLGGGLVPASVMLLAGEPGIGKSTLVLQIVARLSEAGRPCLLVSGEESHGQVASRARRLGIAGEAVTFAPGRDLQQVLQTASAARPFLLAVDSIQSLRDASGAQMPGGASQVRICADALVGLAKAEGLAVLITGHVTKDGDLAGPRSLEHAVDVVLGFDGEARSGLRVLSGGKNRFGPEGEAEWFEMGEAGLRPIDPTGLLISGERVPGAATALPRSGRRALAVEVQALVGSPEGPARRQTTGLDPRRFQLIAAVLDRAAGIPLGRSELFGASMGGIRVEDPACDLAIAAALASAAAGCPPPADAAFVGEVALTGLVRPAPGLGQRISAARAAGCLRVYTAVSDPKAGPAEGAIRDIDGLRVIPVRHVRDALRWTLSPAGTHRDVA